MGTYVKPGVYVSQQYLASGVANAGFIIPVIIGKGLSTKRIWSELMVRGQITDNLTVDAITRRATLSESSDQKYQTSRLYRDGNDMGNASFTYIDNVTVEIKSDYYIPTSTYTFSYLAPAIKTDTVQNNLNLLIYVAGTPDGSRQFKQGIDFIVSDNKIDWSTVVAANITSKDGPFDLDPDNKISIAMDGKAPVAVTITGTTQGAVTADEVAADINSALGADPAYGAAYNAVAVVSGAGVKLTSVLLGESSRINFYVPTSLDATNILFNFTAPHYILGTGSKPAIGDTYYVRYNTTRPSDEYNKVRLFFGLAEAMYAIGPMNADNDLLIAVELAFMNGGTVIGVIQVEDADSDGLYIETDWYAAIEAIRQSTQITEVVLLNTDVGIMAYLVRVIEDEASLLKNHFMGAYFGVAQDATIGDIDTSGTIIYIAANTLQVSGQSQGRGRYVLISTPDSPAPQRTITDSDTRTFITLILDTPFLAAAVVGALSTISPISNSMLRQQIVGFESTSISDNEASASYLASNGVWVLINRGGRIVCFDPVTADSGGEEIFSEPNVRIQKDYLANLIRTRLDNYVIGVMPDDLNDFVHEIKYHIGIVIENCISNKIIAPYIDTIGLTRAIDLMNDVKAYRDTTSKTTYRFVYSFMARYVSKRLYGQYIIDRSIT